MTLSFRIMEEILNIVDEDEFHDQKAIRRNAEKNAKTHSYNARKLENRSIKAAEAGKERAADNLYDKANAEWDKETAEQQRAEDAHRRVEELRPHRKNSINCALDIMDQILSVLEEEKELTAAQKRIQRRGKSVLKPYNQEQAEQKAKEEPKYALGTPLKYPSTKIKEALDLMEEIISYADNIFELDIENKQNISPNKISRIKKDKDGKDVEVVSVADELFPHEGTAKQQFDKKILDKINDMIEGTGSLEDLIQFVRKGVQTKKMVHENKNLFGKETGRGSLEDDISTTLTGNTVHQNIEKGVNKLMGEKRKEG